MSCPTTLITASTSIDSWVPSGVRTRTVHRCVSSDQVADSTSVPKRMLAQAELVGAPAEVFEQHVLGREVQGPVVALRDE